MTSRDGMSSRDYMQAWLWTHFLLLMSSIAADDDGFPPPLARDELLGWWL
jgi:hypothetical protein